MTAASRRLCVLEVLACVVGILVYLKACARNDLDGELAMHSVAMSDVKFLATCVRCFAHRQRRLPRLAELTGRDGDEPPLVEHLPRDPWGHDYALIEGATPDDFVVVSAGPDGVFGTADDIRSRAPQ